MSIYPIKCKRCGTCCLANSLTFIKDEDMNRWKSQKRFDILHIIETWHPIWAGDHLVSSDNGRNIFTCPFLDIGVNICSCSIYETRPEICRNYMPGSSEICTLWEK